MMDDPQKTINESLLPVIADFYAEWCSPCMQMMPVLEETERLLEGKCLVIKINVDKHLDLVEKYKIMGVPTFILFKNGVIINKIPGVLDKQQILDFAASEA